MQRHRYVTLLFILGFMTSAISSRLIDGIFLEPTLHPGYNLVASIPRGAGALNVTELRHTNNYLAIRLQNGTFLFNGNYGINWSGEYEAVGTTFRYFQESAQHLESFAADGPLLEPIDVMVLYQEPNPGIVYRYLMPGATFGTAPIINSGLGAAIGKTSEIYPPSRRMDPAGSMAGDEAPSQPRRQRRRKLAWKASGLTDCNKPCGGGVQSTRFICVREHSQVQVHERRCHFLEKPVGQSLRCNTRPCPAKWRSGPWSGCSVSCGDGVRSREMECVQEVTPVLTMRVADGACIEPRTLPLTEACEMPSCEERSSTIEQTSATPQWHAEAWSQCSATCGSGRRTRVVTCITNGRACNVEDRPAVQEICNAMQACPTAQVSETTNVVSTTEDGSIWLHTEWSQQCSAECGTGVQSRRIFCGATQKGETCDVSNRPEMTRSCSSDRTCSGQWFTGPWTQCSSVCDLGEQNRDVVCITTLGGALRVVLDMNCPANKPETGRSCNGPPCTAAWATSDWTQCTRPCGTQKREVRCLAPSGRSPGPGEEQCKEEERPADRRTCNEHACKASQDIYGVDNTHRVIQVQNDPEISNGLDEEPSCKDNFTNCILVAQARLCKYQFYQKSCCSSCSRSRPDND